MKTIPLTQGREAVVNDCDYDYLNQWKWFYHRDRRGHTGYAKRRQTVGRGRQADVFMHREVAARKITSATRLASPRGRRADDST